MRHLLLFFTFWCLAVSAQQPHEYVDPLIGAEGLGRVYVGPAMPFGMIRPSVDGMSMPNSGWAPMPERIRGFAQTHVSGTGGGQKYGNILVLPFTGNPSHLSLSDFRNSETAKLGYYATQLEESGIEVEISALARSAIYDFKWIGSQSLDHGIAIDCGFFLGESPIPDGREAQMLVGSQVEVIGGNAVKGYSRVRGGWNNGRAYTVYFYAEFDSPFDAFKTWKDSVCSVSRSQYDSHQRTGALLFWNPNQKEVTMRIGISYLSELKAEANMKQELAGKSFAQVRAENEAAWNELLGRAELAASATEAQRRMFYTALYHTMLMPTDRSGENPLWADDDEYYDDYYALWDTYRTSLPLITILDPKREAEIVNSLINIWRRDGYMPDARSGNANGRTQGGSNAEIVIADAYVKGIEGIDYEMALKAMLADATLPPGGNQEAEGRGGLTEYLQLGYIPYGIPRAGNRTVEYSLCDFAIAQVARGLGYDELAEQYQQQSRNWINLWHSDYEHGGAKGFIMPRDAQGNWLDSLPYGHSHAMSPTFAYTPLTFEGPWHRPWWDMFFYEASSWEYSLSMPHDVPALIEACGGPEEFEKRLDIFFEDGYFNVNNEPSFLSPCLYHWIGKPWKSSRRIRQIVDTHYNDGGRGLPGNDDSGAMSSWLAFNMMGLYPNAGHDYYLINAPMVESTTLHLPNGNDFKIVAENFLLQDQDILGIWLNDKPITDYRITHSQILEGGTLKIKLGRRPDYAPAKAPKPLAAAQPEGGPKGKLFTFKLHGQTRRYYFDFVPLSNGDIRLDWGIERNLSWQKGSFTMSAKAVENGICSNFAMPIDGQHIVLSNNECSYILSRKALQDLLGNGTCKWNGVEWELAPDSDSSILHAIDTAEGAEMWIENCPQLPVIVKMTNNPMEVNWSTEFTKR